MIEVYVDGASAGNPGLSGAGIFIKGNGLNERHSVPLGMMSNHEAEFHAFIHGLKICLSKKLSIVSFRTDSQLVNQAVEKESTKNQQFSNLLREALELTKGFELFFLKWIPGRKNKVADELAKQAIQENQPLIQEIEEEESEMGKIIFISHQHANEFDWKSMKKEIEFTWIRTQFGASNEDTMHLEFEKDCAAAGIPFGQFAVGLYSSEDEATNEAELFLKKVHDQAECVMIRVEEDTLSACAPKTIVKATQSFIDICKKNGHKTGLFLPANFYDLFDFDQIKADFVMVSQFTSDEPTVKHDAWHYTNNGEISSYSGPVGLAETNTAFNQAMVSKLKRKRKDNSNK